MELQQKGARAIAIQADVSKKADCDRMVRQAVDSLGGLHIAVNNAGINKNSAAEETPEDEWEATFAVNTRGVFLSCQVCMARLILFPQAHSRTCQLLATARSSTLQARLCC